MLKWIIGFILLGTGIGGVAGYMSEYQPIGKQIDLKTMSLKQPSFLIKKWNSCVGSCTNMSSSSSYGGSSYGGK